MLFNRKTRKFDAYMKESSGNVAIIAALAIIPILSVLGLAVDWQLVVTKKNSVQHTLDATLISAARNRQAGASDAAILSAANRDFDALRQANNPSLECGSVQIGLNPDTDAIEANVRCTQPTTLSAIFGRKELSFQVKTGSEFDSGRLDVAFVFDLSGSMNNGGRLRDLKGAANSAIDILLPDDRTDLDQVRVAISTYNHSVNAGPFFDQTVDFIARRDDRVRNSEIVGEEYDDLVGRVLHEGPRSSGRRFWNYETSRKNRNRRGRHPNSDYSARFYYDPTCVYDRRGPHAASDTAPLSFDRNDRANDTFLTVGHPLWEHSPNNTESDFVHERKRAAEDQVHKKRGEIRLHSGYDPRASNLIQTGDIQFNPGGNSQRVKSGDVLTNGARLRDEISDNFPLDSCRPNNAPVPLTKDADDLRDFIDDMTAGGATAGHLGIAWGWYLLSPKWKDIWPTDSEPLEYDEPDTTKALIIMTDGAFNATHPLDEKSSTELAADYCDNIKRDTNIIIFTIGFRVPNGADTVERSGLSILDHCASTPDFSFPAENADELRDAYRQIAGTISDLRLSQ